MHFSCWTKLSNLFQVIFFLPLAEDSKLKTALKIDTRGSDANPRRKGTETHTHLQTHTPAFPTPPCQTTFFLPCSSLESIDYMELYLKYWQNFFKKRELFCFLLILSIKLFLRDACYDYKLNKKSQIFLDPFYEFIYIIIFTWIILMT